MCSQSSLSITALTTSVSQLCAKHVLSGGWSESSNRGVTHVTEGSRPARMSCGSRSTERIRSGRHRSVWKTPSIAVQRVPEVPGLSGLRRVERPGDAGLLELLGDGLEREARVVLREVPSLVLDQDEHVLADRVAPPALEGPAVGQLAGLDVLGVVERAAGLAGHEEEVVRVGRAADRGEEVVAEHVVLRPRPVVRDRRPLELRVRPRVAELPVAEPVVRAAVHVVQVRRAVVGDVAGEPVRARRERDLLPELHARPSRRSRRGTCRTGCRSSGSPSSRRSRA